MPCFMTEWHSELWDKRLMQFDLFTWVVNLAFELWTCVEDVGHMAVRWCLLWLACWNDGDEMLITPSLFRWLWEMVVCISWWHILATTKSLKPSLCSLQIKLFIEWKYMMNDVCWHLHCILSTLKITFVIDLVQHKILLNAQKNLIIPSPRKNKYS